MLLDGRAWPFLTSRAVYRRKLVMNLKIWFTELVTIVIYKESYVTALCDILFYRFSVLLYHNCFFCNVVGSLDVFNWRSTRRTVSLFQSTSDGTSVPRNITSTLNYSQWQSESWSIHFLSKPIPLSGPHYPSAHHLSGYAWATVHGILYQSLLNDFHPWGSHTWIYWPVKLKLKLL